LVQEGRRDAHSLVVPLAKNRRFAHQVTFFHRNFYLAVLVNG